MKLSNYSEAVIPYKKISAYLLSATHRDGRYKAAFFTRFGFSLDSWNNLANSLLQHAADHEINKTEESLLELDILLKVQWPPNGRSPYIRSVWFIEKGENLPLLVTAYPLRRKIK
jgi:hypothetical protein